MNTGPSVLPGEYKITLNYLDYELTKTMLVEEDPEVNLPLEERTKQHDALLKIYRMIPVISEVSQVTNSVKTELGELRSFLEKIPEVPNTIDDTLSVISSEIDKILQKLNGNPQLGSQARYYSIRGIQAIARAIEGYSEAPSESQIQRIEEKNEELKRVVKILNNIIVDGIPKLNGILNENNIPHIPSLKPVKFDLK
jgi:hypothetical protein